MASTKKQLADLKARVAARQALPPPAERKAIRERAGESLRGVAEAVPCSVQAVLYWEAGAREPKGDHLLGYAAVLTALAEATKATAPA